MSLIEFGYVLISYHTQYIGGKKLWEKLAKLSEASHFDVYVIDNGNVVMDGDKPLKYNGKNLADEKIWKAPAKNAKEATRYVLLMLKKK